MTRLGISSYAYAWAIGVPGYPPPAQPLDHFAFLHRCAEQGVRVVQIADNLPLDKLDDRALSALVAEAQGLNLAIEVGTRGIAPDHLHRYLDIARRCDSPILRVVVASADHQPTVDETINTLRAILPEFEQAGVVLAIENHDRYKVRELVRIIENSGSDHIGICLDTANSFGAMEGIETVVDALGPYMVNLHLKDFIIRRASHNQGFTLTGTPAGQGMLDIPWLLGRLHDTGRDFNAIIELWTTEEAEIEATIQKQADWVTASVAYLRTMITEPNIGS